MFHQFPNNEIIDSINQLATIGSIKWNIPLSRAWKKKTKQNLKFKVLIPLNFSKIFSATKRSQITAPTIKNKTLILAGDETDELGNAFLESLLRILGDLAVGRKSLLHDPADICDRKVPILLSHVGTRAVLAALVTAATPGARRSFSHSHWQS